MQPPVSTALFGRIWSKGQRKARTSTQPGVISEWTIIGGKSDLGIILLQMDCADLSGVKGPPNFQPLPYEENDAVPSCRKRGRDKDDQEPEESLVDSDNVTCIVSKAARPAPGAVDARTALLQSLREERERQENLFRKILSNV